MTAVLPLAVWPYPVPPEVNAAIRRAKMELAERDKLDFLVQACPAVPGSPTRVLSFMGPPPFYCDAAKLRNWQDPEELRNWVEWTLDEQMPAEQGFTKADWMAHTIPGAREVAMPLTVPNPDEMNDGPYFR